MNIRAAQQQKDMTSHNDITSRLSLYRFSIILLETVRNMDAPHLCDHQHTYPKIYFSPLLHSSLFSSSLPTFDDHSYSSCLHSPRLQVCNRAGSGNYAEASSCFSHVDTGGEGGGGVKRRDTPFPLLSSSAVYHFLSDVVSLLPLC
mmetsp:Transcript_28289/g.72167  ORF Transcript_28289/g.72167 Transcript_28289/m.72167 type:complete len:146 (+) Transcript_28289:394-831(+)